MRDVCKTQDEGVIKWDLITPLPVVSNINFPSDSEIENEDEYVACIAIGNSLV